MMRFPTTSMCRLSTVARMGNPLSVFPMTGFTGSSTYARNASWVVPYGTFRSCAMALTAAA